MKKTVLCLIALFVCGCSATLSITSSEDISKCEKIYAEKDYHVVTVIWVKSKKITKEEVGVISIRSKIVCVYEDKSRPAK